MARPTPKNAPFWLKPLRRIVGVVAVVTLVGLLSRIAGVQYRRSVDYVVEGDGRSTPSVVVQSTIDSRLILGLFAVTEGGPPYTLQVQGDVPADITQVLLRSLTVTSGEGAVESVSDVPVAVMDTHQRAELGSEWSVTRGFLYVDAKPIEPTDDWLRVEGSLSFIGRSGEASEVRFSRRLQRKASNGFVTEH